ncbi:hypothetical protein [Polaribacter tangerinus]|uniref:hypothetical protein n=1 Tax=Polaribacter tangerinus TaxID=1920034 RepID=UPI000B4AD00F|nr:hypothetical protein [Polaribacter tangerinus]
MPKKLFLLVLIFNSFFLCSQERRTLINGKVSDSLSTVKNANIINLKTAQGTFSSENGIFRIFVKAGDSLRISSIQHKTSFVKITKEIILNKLLSVRLNNQTIVLDTFELKRHNLMGSLSIDSKSVPTNKKDSLLNAVMDFSEVDMKVVELPDDMDKVKPPIVNTMSGAIAMAGAGATANIPFKYSERLWALRKKLARKKAFPYKILSQLGEKFFFEELKIPVDNYFHFLEYCNPLGIENLHKEKKLLEVIKIFQTESKSYLEIIKKE